MSDALSGAGDAAGEGLRSVNHGRNVSLGLAQLAQQLRENRKQTTLAVLAVLQGQIVEELSTPGRGKERTHRAKLTYGSGKRKGQRKTGAARDKAIARAGRASAPGDPPAPDYGKLRGSIQIEYDDTLRKGRCGTNTEYAAPLNYGTTTAGANKDVIILPRPFMEPALAKAHGAMTEAGALHLRLITRTRLAP